MAEKSLNKEKTPVKSEKPENTSAAAKSPPKVKGGVRIYIGPTIRGRVQYGAVFSSDGAAREELAAELEVWPQLAGLLVSLKELPEARLGVKTPGTSWHTLAGQVKKNLAGR